MKYRPEIDGLRTLAVMPVIFFHAGFAQFSGGFVGVDVFFVISGYLITKIISSDLNLNKFSITEFYVRRAKRILPAMFALLIIASIMAVIISDKDFMEQYAKTLISVSSFTANIYFWKTSSYFDSSSEYNPLLHMWSLSVEEQYYLFFPIILMVLWKLPNKYRFVALLIMFLVSLIVAEWGSVNAPTASFYLLPTRFWELLAGGFVAIYGHHWPKLKGDRLQFQFLSLVGLGLIIWSNIAFDEMTPFPGRYAIAPVLGTVLIIMFAKPGTIAGAMLSSAPFVFIGQISYSAYLWHQPLFAFYRQVVPIMSHAAALMLIGLTLILAYLTWKYVETPFRKTKAKNGRILIVSAIGLVAFVAGGLVLRTYSESLQWSSREAKLIAFMDYKVPRRGSCFLDSAAQGPEKFTADCRHSANDSIFIWGDSHAAALASGFVRLGHPITQFTSNACPPLLIDAFKGQKHCYDINKYILEEVSRSKPNILVLDGYWGRYSTRIEALSATINMIKRASPTTKVVVLGSVPLWPVSLPKYLIMSGLTPDNHLSDKLIYAVNPELENNKKVDEIVKGLIPDGTDFISVEKILCESDRCAVYQKVNDKLELTAFDYGHLTDFGASIVASAILADLKSNDSR